ncbi:hypothetical protein FOVSG1_013737 [Fusarium oxysporum f. sp. vasinfectum]
MAQQELEKRDLSELTAICEDLLKQYASVDPGCSAPRKSAARQQQRFSTITCALFTHFDTSLDLDVIRSLVLKQLVTIRVHLEFAALHDTDFRGTSEVLNSLKDIQGRKWIQKLEGIPSEVLDAVKCTMDRLDELGKVIRQDPDPEVPTDTPDAIHKYVSEEIIRRTTGGVVKETNQAIRLPTRMKRADRKQAHISSKPSMPPRQISSYDTAIDMGNDSDQNRNSSVSAEVVLAQLVVAVE